MARLQKQQKPNARNKFQSLSDAQHEELWTYSKNHTLPQIVDFVMERYQIKTTPSSVSIYLRARRLERQAEKLDADQKTLRKLITKHKSLPPEELDAYAEALFRIHCLEQLDIKHYVDITFHRRKLDLEEMRFHQDERRLALAEKKLDLEIQKAREAEQVGRQGLSDEEKLKRYRQIFEIQGPSDDEDDEL